MKFFLIAAIAVMIFGCQTSLKTRQENAASRRSIPPISEVRKENADLKVKLMNMEEDLRIKDGKIEELEFYIQKIKEKNESNQKDETEVLNAYKDSVESLLAEKKELLKKISLLEEANEITQKKLKSATTPADELLKTGNEKFEEKKWTEAISQYQAYREKTTNKKSSDYALVTYKIGVCFQELGLKAEAKTFYTSVMKNFEGTDAYKYAKYRLSQLEASGEN